jgi:hypothetical protein
VAAAVAVSVSVSVAVAVSGVVVVDVDVDVEAVVDPGSVASLCSPCSAIIRSMLTSRACSCARSSWSWTSSRYSLSAFVAGTRLPASRWATNTL